MPVVNIIKNVKIKLIFFTLLFSMYAVVGEGASTKIAFLNLEAVSISNQLERTINEVLLSFTSELKGYVVEDFRQTDEKTAINAPNVSYIFTGRITGIQDGLRLELIFKNKQLEMVRCIYKDYEGASKILLESRLLVNEIFALPDNEEVAKVSHMEANASLKQNVDGMQEVKNIVDAEFNALYTVDSLAGAWYGEDGEVEKVMIMRGGRGVAIWVSGISILLDLKLQDGILVVSQKGLPQPRQFVSLPDNIASLAAKSAKPITWQFSVDQDLKVLSGLKRTWTVQYKNDQIVSMSEVAVPVRWHRN